MLELRVFAILGEENLFEVLQLLRFDFGNILKQVRERVGKEGLAPCARLE
jgi:hypothetical protein